jgi:hypothetical protein
MFFLAGLLGMMALGSVMIVSTAPVEGDVHDAHDSDGDDPKDEGAEDLLSAAGTVEVSDDVADDGSPDDALPVEFLSLEGISDEGVSDEGVAGEEDQASDAILEDRLPDVSEAPDDFMLDTPDVSAPLPEEHPYAGSLFARLGIINLDDPMEDAEEGASSAETSFDGVDVMDFWSGGAGDDHASGHGGADVLSGQAGADTLLGGMGGDTLEGGAGDDLLMGEAGGDAIYAGDGADTLVGGIGKDSLQGDDGDDVLLGGSGDDALFGREGGDTLIGGSGTDSLFGGAGHDLIDGTHFVDDGAGPDLEVGARDYLNGGDGDDTIAVGSDDVVHGGTGADTMILGSWMTGESAELLDFDAAEDQIVIVYDDSGEGLPELDIRISSDDPDVTEILLDGEVLTTLPTEGAPTLDALVLVGESVAAQLALA